MIEVVLFGVVVVAGVFAIEQTREYVRKRAFEKSLTEIKSLFDEFEKRFIAANEENKSKKNVEALAIKIMNSRPKQGKERRN